MKRGFFVWLVCGVLGVVIVGWFGWARRDTRRLQVSTATVTKGPIVRRVVVAGTLQAVKSVDVGSQVSGMIQSLAADFNSIVRKGQVLARLDPSTFEAGLADAKAMLGQAEADLTGFEVALQDAHRKLARAQTLAAQQLIPQSDLDAAKIAAEQAAADLAGGHAQIARAHATVEQAETNLSHTVITSPVDGVVVSRSVDVGQTVAASFQTPVLFRIAANLQQMQVQADVDEADIGAVKEGQTATFQVESYPNEMFHGTVSVVRMQPTVPDTSAASATPAAGGPPVRTVTNGITYTTIIDVPNPEDRLRPGMTATVLLNGLERGDVIRVPNVASLFRPSLDLLKSMGESAPPDLSSSSSGDEESEQVWQYDGKRLAPVVIRLGLSDAQWAEEVSGPLKPGDTVVTNAVLDDKPLLK